MRNKNLFLSFGQNSDISEQLFVTSDRRSDLQSESSETGYHQNGKRERKKEKEERKVNFTNILRIAFMLVD